ncbi:flagellar biosynthetic protein FliR [Pseudooceanicola sp. HF7]|uniref:flagellar biosynthetic protein FliR n=1 Tax=Pseudooceanicola sp. HF7 TaxID=2721560 RepID=UPI0014302CCE|nr:flagellar biosynthetic protein FliR [Pseudooceanicola sp. HF7]NIZ09723.1 flagellar biosynthetic protein FliR [Pseudooceanicola sp. HF7]
MNELLAHLLDLLRAQGWLMAVILLRVGAFTSFLPAFGEQSVPTRVKLVIAVSLSAIVLSAQPVLPPQPGYRSFLSLLASETVIGLMLGLGLRLFVMGLQTAGSMMAQATSLSQILGGAGVEPLPAIGHVLVIGGLALAMILGLHVHAVLYLLMSYDVLPVGRWPDGADLAQWGSGLVAQSFRLAFSLAAPFIIISLIYNLTLGVINRAMPQLMVAFVGAPVITFGGLALLFLLSRQILTVWSERMFAFLTAPF